MLRLEELANVALRVPSILVLDLLYKCDIEGLTDRLKAKNEDMLFKYKYLIWNMYYIGKFLFCFFLWRPPNTNVIPISTVTFTFQYEQKPSVLILSCLTPLSLFICLN